MLCHLPGSQRQSCSKRTVSGPRFSVTCERMTDAGIAQPLFRRSTDWKRGSRQTPGRLTIYFGMAPGVGKTHAMLQAARSEALAGREVVVAFVQTHGSKAIDALLRGLEQIPGRMPAAGSASLSEMDLDAVVARRPHLVVVDELAHANPPGSRHPSRYQDIQELLAAGIDVFTTLNLHEFASEATTVQRITGLPLGTTVPDSVFDGAELQLVDMAPQKLLKRLHIEMPYLTQDTQLSAIHFFSESNLMALRQLSWRLVADHLARRTSDYMQQQQIAGPWRSGPRLLAVLSPGSAPEQIVRWTRRLADSLNASWIVLYVETPRTLDAPRHAEITRVLALAEELGAQVVTTTDDDLVRGVLRVASQRNTTQIIIGKSSGSTWRGFTRNSFLRRLIRASGDFEIRIVPAEPEAPLQARRGASLSNNESQWRQYAVATAVVAVITLITFFFGSRLGGPYAGALIYLLGVVALGSSVSRGPTFMAALLSALLWNYLVLPPVFAFQVAHVQDALLLGTFFVVAVILGQLTTQIRAQQQAERLREDRATALYLLIRELNEATTLDHILQQAISNMEHAFKARVMIFYAETADQPLHSPHPRDSFEVTDADQQAIAWVARHGERAGKFTSNFPAAVALHVPLSTTGGVIGVASLRWTQSFPPTIHQLNLLDSFSQQIAFALDRHRLRQVSERATLLAESERLSKALLNSMSHEMRTPIAVITSAINNLVNLEKSGDEEARSDTMTAIQDAAARLNRLVGNLLSITRLESGHVKPRITACDPGDLIRVAVLNTESELAGHKLVVDVPPDLPFARMDFHLMEQVLVNLLSNAAVHTPPGTLVEIRARAERHSLIIEVADRGPGIPAESMERLFDKFYRGPMAPTGGTGLGLSLVKGFVEAQGGIVEVMNRMGSGAVFRVHVPAETISKLSPETDI